jgi:hypothetical protein
LEFSRQSEAGHTRLRGPVTNLGVLNGGVSVRAGLEGRKAMKTGLFGGVLLAMTISPHVAASVTPIPEAEFVPMVAPETSLTPNGAPDPILAQSRLTLQVGEIRRVFGRVEITSTATGDVWVETYTVCVAPDGTESQRGGAGQNHEGKNTPVGPSYPTEGHLVLYPLLLFKAPTTGTYVCQLRGTSEGPLTAVATSFEGSNTTWLRVSAANDAGAAWWQNGNCDEYGNTNGASAPNGTPSWCVYLDGASHQLQAYVFDNDGDGTTELLWSAANDAAFVDASDSLMLTTCYQNTGSCTNGNKSGSDGTVVDSHLELIQLNAAGADCKVAQSPDQVSAIGTHPHHYMIYHRLLAVPVYPSCGSRTFKLRIYVKYVSGSPVKIDGWTFTHAVAINSFYGTAPAVPNVVGLTESAASNALTASGYAVSIVSKVFSTAPADSVISQYPSAGIIELPGSGVNLTVSTGSVSVPNVLSLPESTATDSISAAGLVPRVSFSQACIDPGTVLTQAPLAGSQVAPSSTVNITVDSGTRTTCVLK